MEMPNALLSIRTGVHYHPVTAVGQPLLLGNTGDHVKKASECLCRHTRGRVQSRDVFSRHDQHVAGSLRLDVTKCDRVGILVDDIRRQLARDDAAKKAVIHRPV